MFNPLCACGLLLTLLYMTSCDTLIQATLWWRLLCTTTHHWPLPRWTSPWWLTPYLDDTSHSLMPPRILWWFPPNPTTWRRFTKSYNPNDLKEVSRILFVTVTSLLTTVTNVTAHRDIRTSRWVMIIDNYGNDQLCTCVPSPGPAAVVFDAVPAPKGTTTTPLLAEH